MELEAILKVIEAVSASELTEFSYTEGETKLNLSKKQQKQVVNNYNTYGTTSESTMAMPALSVNAVSVTGDEAFTQNAKEEPAYTGNEIKSPLVGTFYGSPSPDAQAFVKVGDTVKKGQTLGIVEAMKLMNEIESEFDGVVQAILVENEEIVEYGQPLFIIG